MKNRQRDIWRTGDMRFCGTVTAMGEGSCAVDARKQRRICSTAAWYLMEYHLPATTPCRFDVVSVDGEEISLIQDAFAYRN